MSQQSESPWSYLLVRTRDGEPQGWVEPAGFGSWGRRLDGGSNGSHDFHLATNPEVWSRMRPARRTLVVCYDRQPVYAGVIWSARYNRNAGTVTLTHEDIWSIWKRRFAIAANRAWEDPDLEVIETSASYSGITRQTHAKRVIQMGLNGMSGPIHSYELPIILPSDNDSNWTFTWPTYDFHTVSSAFARIQESGGPMQIDFPMELDNQGRFRWRLQVTYESSVQTHLYPEVDQSPVIELSLTHDMTDYASEFQITGSGQDTDTLHRFHWLGDVGGDLVALAIQHADGTIETDDELIQVRDGLAERHGVASVQTDMTVALGGENGLSPHDFTLGQQVHVHLNDDPVIPRIDGGHVFMLIGYTPSGPGALNLELAPINGYTGYNVGEPTMQYRNLNASRTQDLTQRVNRAEKRLVYPRAGAAVAATTTTTED